MKNRNPLRSLFVAFLAFLPASTLVAGQKDKTLDIYWIDVEGGGATLIVTPEDESILIDTGNPGVRDPERIHHVITQVAGLKQLDHMIITHWHSDHFGGAAEIAAKLPVINTWDKGVPKLTPDNKPNDTRFLLMIKPYKEMKIGKRNTIKADDLLPLRQPSRAGAPRLTLRCIAANQIFTKQKPANAPAAKCEDIRRKPKDTSDNANSVAVRLDFGPWSFFDGGDTSWNVEGELVCPDNLIGGVDVYQVNHHGLDRSNNPVFVHALEPTISVMCNGRTKGCMPESFASLSSSPTIKTMYQLHRNERKDSENNTDSKFIANLHGKGCQGNYIKLSASPDGTSYTVTIPSNGHSQTYKTKGQ